MEARYSEIIASLELLDVFLVEMRCKRLGYPDPDVYPEVRASFSAGKSRYHQTGEQLDVDQEFSFLVEECGKEGEKKAHKLFELQGTFSLRYHADIAMDDELFGLFKTRNIPVNLHPYVRELIQSVMARAGLPVFTLPALKIKR